MFEYKIVIRDALGRPVGYKTISTESANDLANFHERYKYTKPTKKNKIDKKAPK